MNLSGKTVGVPVMHPVALGRQSGTVTLTVTPGSSGHTFVDLDPNENGASVPMLTLDSFGFQDVGFIKVDCEGYERQVLEGGVETIERERPVIIVEQKPDMASRYGLDDTSAVPFLQDLGMRKVAVMNGDYIMRF